MSNLSADVPANFSAKTMNCCCLLVINLVALHPILPRKSQKGPGTPWSQRPRDSSFAAVTCCWHKKSSSSTNASWMFALVLFLLGRAIIGTAGVLILIFLNNICVATYRFCCLEFWGFYFYSTCQVPALGFPLPCQIQNDPSIRTNRRDVPCQR